MSGSERASGGAAMRSSAREAVAASLPPAEPLWVDRTVCGRDRDFADFFNKQRFYPMELLRNIDRYICQNHGDPVVFLIGIKPEAVFRDVPKFSSLSDDMVHNPMCIFGFLKLMDDYGDENVESIGSMFISFIKQNFMFYDDVAPDTEEMKFQMYRGSLVSPLFRMAVSIGVLPENRNDLTISTEIVIRTPGNAAFSRKFAEGRWTVAKLESAIRALAGNTPSFDDLCKIVAYSGCLMFSPPDVVVYSQHDFCFFVCSLKVLCNVEGDLFLRFNAERLTKILRTVIDGYIERVVLLNSNFFQQIVRFPVDDTMDEDVSRFFLVINQREFQYERLCGDILGKVAAALDTPTGRFFIAYILDPSYHSEISSCPLEIRIIGRMMKSTDPQHYIFAYYVYRKMHRICDDRVNSQMGRCIEIFEKFKGFLLGGDHYLRKMLYRFIVEVYIRCWVTTLCMRSACNFSIVGSPETEDIASILAYLVRLYLKSSYEKLTMIGVKTLFTLLEIGNMIFKNDQRLNTERVYREIIHHTDSFWQLRKFALKVLTNSNVSNLKTTKLTRACNNRFGENFDNSLTETKCLYLSIDPSNSGFGWGVSTREILAAEELDIQFTREFHDNMLVLMYRGNQYPDVVKSIRFLSRKAEAGEFIRSAFPSLSAPELESIRRIAGLLDSTWRNVRRSVRGVIRDLRVELDKFKRVPFDISEAIDKELRQCNETIIESFYDEVKSRDAVMAVNTLAKYAKKKQVDCEPNFTSFFSREKPAFVRLVLVLKSSDQSIRRAGRRAVRDLVTERWRIIPPVPSRDVVDDVAASVAAVHISPAAGAGPPDRPPVRARDSSNAPYVD